LPLDQRIGGKRRRHRHQLDRGRIGAGLFKHRVNRAGNADGKIMPGGQRLGLGQHLALVRPLLRAFGLGPQHGIGIGAACVDAEEEGFWLGLGGHC